MNIMVLTYTLGSNEHVTRYNLDNLADTTRAVTLMRDLLATRLNFRVTYTNDVTAAAS